MNMEDISDAQLGEMSKGRKNLRLYSLSTEGLRLFIQKRQKSLSNPMIRVIPLLHINKLGL